MKLVDFYKNTVRQSEEQSGGWAKLYYGVLTRVINENNYKRVAEVGIGYGTHAKYILQTTQLNELILIDPTKFYPNDMFAEDIMSKVPEVQGNTFNELYDLIQTELSPWKGRYTWYRKESLAITEEEVPTESLDCVFIDGDHSYSAVRKDLEFWWKKVRSGGELLGDDYWMTDVARAVREFADSYTLNVDFLYREGSEYKIFRIKKI